MNATPLLSIRDLSVAFRTRDGVVKALDRVNLQLTAGEMLGVVGESGSGKSVTAFAALGLLDPAARIEEGEITLAGVTVNAANEALLRELRGHEVAMIFQNPRSALNPLRTVGRQLSDVLRRHRALTRRQAWRAAAAALAQVQISDPERRLRAYPFELSGGQCQRVMIAMALSCSPRLLIADEPTTALDVTTQGAIMNLIQQETQRRRLGVVLITHDLALAASYCQRIAVMHAGQVVEVAAAERLLHHPSHPYTQQLLAATPTPQSDSSELAVIPGELPDLRRSALPPCRFAERCQHRRDLCDEPALALAAIAPQHWVACRRALP